MRIMILHWINNPEMVKRVKELYPTKDAMNDLIEQDRKGFLATMAKIKEGMIWGEDKNLYVEPIIWTVEHVRFYIVMKKFITAVFIISVLNACGGAGEQASNSRPVLVERLPVN